MNIGINGKAAAAVAVCAFSILLAGCGGDEGGVAVVAPASLEARSYNFSESTGAASAVSFTSPNSYTFQHPTGSVEQGSYTGTRDGNTWTATLSSSPGGQQIFIMTFASASGGSYVLKRSEEVDRTGTFAARGSTIPSGNIPANPNTSGAPEDPTTSTTGTTTTTGTTGTTSTSGGVTPSDQYSGFSPVSMAGRTMLGTRTFTSTGPTGQTHTYTFGNGTFHDSDSPEEADGTFTYSANNSSATLALVYTAPTDFVGDRHTMTMTFTAKDRGTFESAYTRGDGTQITINGTFEIEAMP